MKLISVSLVLVLTVELSVSGQGDIDGSNRDDESAILTQIIDLLKENQKQSTDGVLAMERIFYHEYSHGEQLKSFFDKLDADGNGEVTASDFSGYLRTTGRTSVSLATFEKEMDTRGVKPTYADFLPYFQKWDANKDGFWQQSDVAKHYEAVWLPFTDADWKKMYTDKADKNLDGKLSPQEVFDHLTNIYRDE